MTNLTQQVKEILKNDPASHDNPRRLDTVYFLEASGLRYMFSPPVLERIVWALSDPRLASPESVATAARRVKAKGKQNE